MVLVAISFASAANAVDVPQTFTLDGQLFSDSTGAAALVDSSITMKVQILDEDRICVLYEESQSVNTVFSKGYFSVQIGSAVGDPKRSGSDTANGMSSIFQNISNISGKKLADGTLCTVTAAGGKRRYVRIAISPSTMGGSTRTLSPDLTLDSVPNAIVAERAESLQGYRSTDILKVNTASGTALSQANLESLFTSATRFNALSSMVDGTSTNYMRTTAGGAQLPVFTGAPTSPVQGSFWFDTSDQKMKYRTGTGTTEILGTSSGTLTSLTGDVTATGSGAVSATVTAVGGSTAANVHAAEVLANAATSANTASTIVKRDATGNFAAGTVTGNLVGSVTGAASLNVLKTGDTMTGNLNFGSGKGLVLTDSAANTVSISAPTSILTNYVLKLPPAVASTSGQVLSSDTSGNLSWLSLPAAPVGSVAVTAPIVNSGTTSAPNISIPVASSTVNGYLSSADWTTFNSKTSSTLNSGNIWVGNALNSATGVTLSQDAAISNTGAVTVTGIRGRSISSIAATDGQILKYVNSTTTWTPTNIGVGDLLTSTGTSQFSSASCAANQTLTWTSLTNTFTCSNISGLDVSALTAGTLPVARGGTGNATLTSGSILVGAGTSATTALTAGAAGNVVYGTSASAWSSGAPDTAGLVDKSSAQTISGAKSFTSNVQMNAQNALRLYDSSTTNYVALRAPSSVTSNYTLNLPTTQGAAQTVLSNDGAGNLSWTASTGALSGLTAATATNTIDNLNYGQTWNWSTATTQSPMSIAANALTTGSILNLTSASSSLNSANGILNVANSSTSTTGVLARFQSNAAAGSGMTILGNGNVGIGTTTPGQKLDVQGNANLGGSVFPSLYFSPTSGASKTGQIYQNADTIYIAAAGLANVAGFNLNAPASSFTVDGSGNVGIGTSAPLATLDVAGNVNRGILWPVIARNTDNNSDIPGNQTGVGMKLNLSSGSDGSNKWAGIVGQSEGQYGGKVGLAFYTSNSAAPTEKVRIDNSGNVGIGTTTPGASLDVKGGVRISGSTSGYVGLAVPATGGSTTYTLPSADGSSGQLLSTNGSGTLSWSSASSGGITSLGGQTAAAQTFAAGSSGTSPAISSSGSVHTLNVPLASATGVTSGTISKTDYDNFNSKLTSPLTTKGDLLTYSTTNARMPAGIDGQVLSADSTQTTGLKWATSTGGTVTSVTSANSYLTVATGTTTPAITANVGTIANTLAAGNDSRITGALQLSAYNNDVALAANCTTSQTPYWNTVSDAWACQNINLSGAGYFINGGNSLGASATIGTNDAYSLGLKTNNVSRLTIDPSGNVGIGTTLPEYLFDVRKDISNGSQAFLGNNTQYGLRMGAQTADTFGTIQATQVHSTDNINLALNPYGGNVGVGTTTPTAQLDIIGSSHPNVRIADSATSGYGYIQLGRSGTATNNFHIGSENDGTFRLWNGNWGSGTSILTATASGNVGIGTTSPSYALDVNAPNSYWVGQFSSNYDAFLRLNGTSGSSRTGLMFSGRGGSNAWLQYTDDIAKKMYFRPTYNINDSTPVTLALDGATGNVGIGTTSPGGLLDVNQTTTGSIALQGQNAGAAFWKVLNPAGGATNTWNAANAIEYVGKDTGTNRSINAAGTVNATGADFAEWVDWTGGAKPEMGSVILYRGSYVVVSSPFMAAFIGNDIKDPDQALLVAFAGQLPVLIRGQVHEGDLIVANDDGTARAVAKSDVTLALTQKAVGTAWASSNDPGLKRVNVAVGIGLSGGGAREIASKADKGEVSQLKYENEKLKQENAAIQARLDKIEKALNSK